MAQTTAHTLSFTFALLALYPEVQEKMLKHIRSVIPDGRRPVGLVQQPFYTVLIASSGIWRHAQSDLYHGVRFGIITDFIVPLNLFLQYLQRNDSLVPPCACRDSIYVLTRNNIFHQASAITKFAPEDTSITVGNCYSDEQRRIPVPKGTKLTIDIAAVQRNRGRCFSNRICKNSHFRHQLNTGKSRTSSFRKGF